MNMNSEKEWLEAIDRVWKQLLVLLSAVACLLILTMVTVICADVLARAFRLGNLPWASEVAEYTLYLATFLAAPWLLREGRHVRMDMVLRAIPSTMAWTLELLADVLAAATCFVLAIASLNAVLSSASQGSLIMKIFVFPEWWVLAPASVMFALLGVEFLFRFRRQWKEPKTVREEATSAA